MTFTRWGSDVAGEDVQYPDWPGVTFHLPHEAVRLDPARDYTAEGFEASRQAGARRARERQERFWREFLGDT